MKNGLSPKLHFLIIIGIALVCFAFLVSRPKTIVKDEIKAVSSNTPETAAETAGMHTASPEAVKMAAEIRQKYATDANPLNVYRALAEMFYKASVFDSSAYYYEQIAVQNPGTENWIKTGDAYLQAYSLSLNPVKVEEMAEKTRAAYTNALKSDPTNLHAKTNSALTFVNSQNPMRAITILREVLDQQPNYVPAIISLGKLSMQSQQFDKAADRFREVLKIDKNSVDAKIGLAYSFIELNKTEDAKALLNEILSMEIDPIVKDEVRKTLNNLK